MDTAYPEHERLAHFAEKSKLIADFIEFAALRDVVFGTHADNSDSIWFVPTRRPEMDKLLAHYFGIDWHELQTEKDRMVRDTREAAATCQKKASANES